MGVIHATDTVRQPFAAIRNNPLPWLFVLGGVTVAAIASALPVGGLAGLAVWVLLSPATAILVRGHMHGQRLTFEEAWKQGQPFLLRTLGYGLLVGAVYMAVMFAALLVAGTVAFAASSLPLFLLALTALAVPPLLVATWWGTLTTAAAMCGVPSPAKAFRLVPVGRSVGGMALAGIVFMSLSFAIMLPALIVLAATIGANYETISAFTPDGPLPEPFTDGTFLLPILLFGLCSVPVQTLGFAYSAGIACLFPTAEATSDSTSDPDVSQSDGNVSA